MALFTICYENIVAIDRVSLFFIVSALMDTSKMAKFRICKQVPNFCFCLCQHASVYHWFYWLSTAAQLI